MGAGYIGKTTNGADDIRGASEQSEREDMWGELPGEIVSFDPANQTATIRPLYKKRLDGVPTELPELLEVPVRFQRAGGAAMTFPVKAGDKVSLRPQMRNEDAYHQDGSAFEATSTRSFSLSDMEAHLAGGESLSDPIKNFDPANAHMRFDPEGKYGLRGSPDGKIAIEGSQGNPYKLLAQAVRLLGEDNHQGSPHQNKAAILAIADKLDAMAL